MMAWQDWQQWPTAWGQAGSRLLAHIGQKRAWIISVNLLLIIGLAASLAELSWRVLPAAEQAAVPIAAAATAVSPRQQPRLNVARWQLFGQYNAVPVTGQLKLEEMPETRLKLVLRGVFSGGDGAGSGGGAIIAAPSGKQAFYALGAYLPGGAVLKEVHQYHIVLLRNGQLETLRLPRDKLKDMDGGPGAKKMRSSARPRAGWPSRQPQKSLREYRDTLLEDPQQLADVIKARPYRRDGVRGFQVNPGRDAALFARLGLEANDIIISVNGIQLDSPARGLSVLQTLKKEGPVMVEILRAGMPQVLSIDFDF